MPLRTPLSPPDRYTKRLLIIVNIERMNQFNFNPNYTYVLLLFFIIMPNHSLDLLKLEKPQYEVVQKFKDFELCNYEPYLVAQVKVEGKISNGPVIMHLNYWLGIFLEIISLY